MRDMQFLPTWVLESIDQGFAFDDFFWYISPHLWTATVTDSGTVLMYTTEPGGIVALTPSDGTVADNDEVYLGWTNKCLTLAAGQPVRMFTKFKFAEGNTNTSNLLIGLMSTSAANALLDDAGGPAASYTGAVLFKQDGQLNWQAEVSNGGTQSTKALTADLGIVGPDTINAGQTYWQTLEIEIAPKSVGLSKCTVTFVLNGTPVAKFDNVDYSSSPAAMSPVFGLKNGAITAVETLYVDMCYAGQVKLRQ